MKCYAIRPGTLLIIPAGKYHRSFYRPGEASGRFRIRFFPKELTEEAQTALLNLKPVYHVEGTPMVDFFSVKNNLFLGVETLQNLMPTAFVKLFFFCVITGRIYRAIIEETQN